MATWRNDFFSLLAYKRQGVVVRVPRKYWPEAGIFDVRKYLAAILCSFFTNWPWCYTSKDWLIFPFKAVIKTTFIAFWQLKNQTFFAIVHNVMNTLIAMTKTSPANKMSLGSHGIVCGGGGGGGGGGEREKETLFLPPPPTLAPSLDSNPEIAKSAFSPSNYKTIIYLRVWASYQQIWRFTDTLSTCNLTLNYK